MHNHLFAFGGALSGLDPDFFQWYTIYTWFSLVIVCRYDPQSDSWKEVWDSR